MHASRSSAPTSRRIAYIVRRQASGGGAEAAARRLGEHLSPTWSVHRLSAGQGTTGGGLPGVHGPGWWRAWRFARAVDALLKDRPGVILNLERGPDCDIYRAGDGVHLRWRSLRFGSSPAWMLNPLHWLYPRLEAKTVHSARFVAANSRMVRREMEQYYPWAAHKLRVVPNGFDPALFHVDPGAAARIRADLDLSPARRLFLFVGGGWRRKGLDRALALVAGCNSGLRQDDASRGVLAVIGKGDRDAYAGRIRALNLESDVRFLGQRADVSGYYQAADAFILPTQYDPFSNASLEALACGCPVLTTRRNGVCEHIEHGQTGFLLADDPREAAAWLRETAIDRDRVAQSVAHLTVEQEMGAFSALMEECLSA